MKSNQKQRWKFIFIMILIVFISLIRDLIKTSNFKIYYLYLLIFSLFYWNKLILDWILK
jgi:hypothetical protein